MSSGMRLKDLASMLKLSVSAVSKALNDSPDISLETKNKVREYAEFHGYVPNHYARSLKSKKTKTIGVVVPNVINDFFAKVLHGLEKEASKQDFTLLITFSNDKKSTEKKNILSLINHGVDGILISFSKETQQCNDYETIKKIKAYDIPVVMFDRVNKDLTYDSVVIDDFIGAQEATKALLHSGCKKIAFLSPLYHTSVGKLREEGYLKAINETKVAIPPFVIKLTNYVTFKTMLADLMKEHAFDGILAANQYAAIYGLNTLQQIGYHVPQDVSIIGFTDGPMALACSPTLSVVSQHADKLAAKAFNLLWERLDKKRDLIKNIVMQPKLVHRESTNYFF